MARETSRSSQNIEIPLASASAASSITDLLSPTKRSQSHYRHSRVFWAIRYPILVMIAALILLNLTLYFMTRFLVLVIENLYDAFLGIKEMKLLTSAKNYNSWIKAAVIVDRKLGLEEWKKAEVNDEILYDEELCVSVSQKLRACIDNNDLPRLMECLKSAAGKNDLGGVELEQLYSRCYSGTRVSVDAYYNVVEEALDTVAMSEKLSGPEKGTFFKQIGTTFGRTALCLSGEINFRATFGYFHLGVMSGLFEQGLLPTILTGTSAGSMMAAMVCCRTDDELHEIFDPSLSERIHCLEKTWREMMSDFFKTGALLTAEFFRDEAYWFTKGDMTFLEAFELTGRVLNISVMSNEPHAKSKLLNYINSPNITIRSAVVASSAIPGLLPPCPLFFKDENNELQQYFAAGKLWRDGSLRADIPEKELQQFFRVKYTIVSQANPHLIIFFFRSRGCPGSPFLRRGWRGGFVLATLVKLFLLEVKKWLDLVRDMELLPRINDANMSNLFSQSFEGNLTVLPKLRWVNIMNLMTDPDYTRLKGFLEDGRNQTWPIIKPLSNRMKIENKITNFLGRYRPKR